jgi:transposase-like protein
VIVTAVRWYCRVRLSLADVSDLLAERGIDVSPRTILTLVHEFGPLLAAAVRRAVRPVGRRWYCDETYVRVAGRWVHTCTGLHRARGETTKPIERSHVLIKDRLRPMRGLRSVATGQRLLEGIEAIRRGDLLASRGLSPTAAGVAARARAEVAALHQLADELRLVA